MGRSAGAGSPLWFMCPREREERWNWRSMGGHWPVGEHRITLTGRTRPYHTKSGSALGSRSTLTSREWNCSCGRTGWSNHSDLERMAAQS